MKALTPISATPSSTHQDLEKKRLKESCQDFESFMTSSMLKTMRESVARAEEPSQALSIYEEMMDQTVSKDFSRGKGLGLGETLYKILEPSIRQETQTAATASGAQVKVREP